MAEGGDASQAAELQTKARQLLLQDKPQQATRAAKEALAISRGLGDSEGEAKALGLVCEGQVAAGKPKQAVLEAEDALKRFRQAGDAVGVASGLEVCAVAKLHAGDTEAALVAAEEALELARNGRQQRLELSILQKVCEIRSKAGRYEEAAAAMQDAAVLAKGLRDPAAEADALRRVAYAYLSNPAIASDADGIAQATDAIQEARSLFNEAGDTSGEASALMVLAMLKSLDPNKNVLPNLQESRKLYKRAGDVEGESRAMEVLMDALPGSDEAVETGSARVELWRARGDMKMQADSMYRLAKLHFDRGELDEAVADIVEARAVCKEAGLSTKAVEANLLLLQTQIHIQEMSTETFPDDPDDLSDSYCESRLKAHRAVKEAMLLSGKAGNVSMRAAALFWRAEVLVWTLRPAEALEAALQAKSLFDKVQDERGVVNSMILVADLHWILKQKDEARSAIDEALQLAKSTPNFEDVVEAAESVKAKMVVQRQAAAVPQYEMIADAPVAAPVAAASAVVKAKGLDGEMVKRKVLELVQNVLTGDEEVEPDTPFMEAGIDSLGSVQLVTDVGREFSMALAPSVVFDFPTMRELCNHLVEESKSG